MAEKVELSRRTFIATGAVAALSAGTDRSLIEQTAATAGRPAVSPGEEPSFDQRGVPSRTAERAWARAEYDHLKDMREQAGVAQQGSPDGGNQSESGLGSPTSPNFDNVVDAVADLGVDPNGNRPISEDLDSSIEDGTLIVFPPGTYLVSGDFRMNVDGSVGMVGEGYDQASSPPEPGENAATFVAADGARAAINFGAETGLFANFVMDQSGNNNSISIKLNSSGFIQARDVRFIGTQDNTGSEADERQSNPMFRFVTGEGTTARAERVVGQYIGLPGDKNSGGDPFFWVGESNEGTAQMGNCVSVGAADNGLYGGRTPGKAQVKGGTYKNNAVSQLRYDGAESWADGVTMVVDAENYEGPTDGATYNEEFGTQGLKTERRKFQNEKPSGAVLRNADIQVRSVNSGGMGAPVFIRGWAGSLKIENCRIVCQLDQPTVRAEAPGTNWSATETPHNITITDSEIVGSNADSVIEVNERPNSVIRNTCIKVPGATPDSISGMDIGGNVGFGEQCTTGGLKNPEIVGSSGNLSSLPAPSNSGSSPGFLEGIANYVIGGARDLAQGLLKGFAAILIAPFLVLILIFLLLFGPLFVVIIFLLIGQKALKE